MLGLIGPNGAGKTTLVNTVCGVTPANSGRSHLHGTGHHAHQDLSGGAARACRAPSRSCSHSPNSPRSTMSRRRRCSRSAGESLKSAREEARAHLAFVGLDAQAAQSAATLTLAMRKRLELAKALAMKPKLLFLDEVNAGLNSAEVERATKLIHQACGRRHHHRDDRTSDEGRAQRLHPHRRAAQRPIDRRRCSRATSSRIPRWSRPISGSNTRNGTPLVAELPDPRTAGLCAPATARSRCCGASTWPCGAARSPR